MIKKNILAIVLTAGTILAAASPALASEATPHKVDSTDKNTDATVKIIEKTVDPDKPVTPDPKDPDKPDPDKIANLTFVEAPKAFYFETALKDGAYSLTADKTTTYNGHKAISDDAQYKVFSDAAGAHYEVKSVIDKQLTTADGAKKVDVSSFKINDREIANIEGGGTVMSHNDKAFTSGGYVSLPVDSIKIDFAAAPGTEIKENDVYTGNIQNTLYNVYNETLTTDVTP